MLPTITAIFAMLLAVAIQSALPAWSWLGNVRWEFIPGIVAYAALAAKRPLAAVAWAGLAGLAQDAFSAGPFGCFAAAYALAALVLWWWRELLDPDLPWVQLLAGALVALIASLAAIVVVGASWVAVGRLFWLTLMGAVVTPVIFLAVDFVRLHWGETE